MKGILATAFLTVAATTSAATETAEPVRFQASARVQLDDTGVPRRVTVSERLPPFIRQMVQ